MIKLHFFLNEEFRELLLAPWFKVRANERIHVNDMFLRRLKWACLSR